MVLSHKEFHNKLFLKSKYHIYKCKDLLKEVRATYNLKFLQFLSCILYELSLILKVQNLLTCNKINF